MRSWTDDAEDLPLLFSFGYVDVEGMAQTVTSATTQSSIAGLVLPAGDLVMTVVVADQLGATTTATGASPLTVATQVLSANAVDNLLLDADNILNSGNPEAAQRLLVALAMFGKATGQRRRLQATSAASAFNTMQIKSMLTSAERAAALSDRSAEARLQSAGVLAALLSAVPDVLDGPTRVQGLEQLDDLLEIARADGVDAGMVANVMTALDAVLLADTSKLVPSDMLTIGTTSASSIRSLGLALLAGAAPGEEPARASGDAFTVGARCGRPAACAIACARATHPPPTRRPERLRGRPRSAANRVARCRASGEREPVDDREPAGLDAHAADGQRRARSAAGGRARWPARPAGRRRRRRALRSAAGQPVRRPARAGRRRDNRLGDAARCSSRARPTAPCSRSAISRRLSSSRCRARPRVGVYARATRTAAAAGAACAPPARACARRRTRAPLAAR
jgi:hypothetical protein